MYIRVLCYTLCHNDMIHNAFSYYLRLLIRRDGGALAVPDDEYQDQIVNVIYHRTIRGDGEGRGSRGNWLRSAAGLNPLCSLINLFQRTCVHLTNYLASPTYLSSPREVRAAPRLHVPSACRRQGFAPSPDLFPCCASRCAPARSIAFGSFPTFARCDAQPSTQPCLPGRQRGGNRVVIKPTKTTIMIFSI